MSAAIRVANFAQKFAGKQRNLDLELFALFLCVCHARNSADVKKYLSARICAHYGYAKKSSVLVFRAERPNRRTVRFAIPVFTKKVNIKITEDAVDLHDGSLLAGVRSN